MDTQEIESKLKTVFDVYTSKYGINPDSDYFLLKIQEELGELSAAHLKLTQRARLKEASQEQLEKNLREEIADVLAMTILFAKSKGLRMEDLLNEKWFKYLND